MIIPDHGKAGELDGELFVSVDGSPKFYVTEYCISEGWAIVFQTNPKTGAVLWGDDGNVLTERLEGKIAVWEYKP